MQRQASQCKPLHSFSSHHQTLGKPDPTLSSKPILRPIPTHGPKQIPLKQLQKRTTVMEILPGDRPLDMRGYSENRYPGRVSMRKRGTRSLTVTER